MNILNLVDKHLENPFIKNVRRKRKGHYPSEASCIVKNEYDEDTVAGNCLRSVYWSCRGTKKTNPMTARGFRITRYGKLIEQYEIEKYKELGIWRGNNIKFFNEKFGISGEIDGIVFDSGVNKRIGVEIKTGYDYKFRREVLGNSYRKGRPKLNHLLQTMLYIDHFCIPFKIIYIDRGNAARGEFYITLNKDGTPNVDGKKVINGISIPGCIRRIKDLDEHLEDSTLPGRDFQLQYSQERINFLYDSGRLNKAQRKEFEKNKKVDIGDYQCGYCDYKDYCWKVDKKNE